MLGGDGTCRADFLLGAVSAGLEMPLFVIAQSQRTPSGDYNAWV